MAAPLGSSTSSPTRPSSTSPTQASSRPTGRPAATKRLSVVPGRRRFVWFAVTLTVLVSAVMMGAVFLHTRIAERQLEIDRLERAVRQAQEDFDVLRAERAELRSPTRLASGARALGMTTGEESSFVPVDPMVLAVTIARTGQPPIVDDATSSTNIRLEPLDQFRLVKSVSSETP